MSTATVDDAPSVVTGNASAANNAVHGTAKSAPATATAKSAPATATATASSPWDRYLAKWLVNGGTGLATGVALSVLLFRRRMWPVTFGFAFMSGVTYEECRSAYERRLPVGTRLVEVETRGAAVLKK